MKVELKKLVEEIRCNAYYDNRTVEITFRLKKGGEVTKIMKPYVNISNVIKLCDALDLNKPIKTALNVLRNKADKLVDVKFPADKHLYNFVDFDITIDNETISYDFYVPALNENFSKRFDNVDDYKEHQRKLLVKISAEIKDAKVKNVNHNNRNGGFGSSGTK